MARFASERQHFIVTYAEAVGQDMCATIDLEPTTNREQRESLLSLCRGAKEEKTRSGLRGRTTTSIVCCPFEADDESFYCPTAEAVGFCAPVDAQASRARSPKKRDGFTV